MVDLSGQITYASPRALEMWGNVTEAEVLGTSILDVIVPRDREKARAKLADALALMGSLDLVIPDIDR